MDRGGEGRIATPAAHEPAGAARRAPWARLRRRAAESSLETRLTALVLVALLPALAIEAWSALEILEAREREARGEVIRLAQFGAGELDRIIDNERATLETIARAPTVVQGEREACGAFLREVAASTARLRGFAVADRAGEIVCLSHPGERAGVADHPLFAEALARGGFVIGGYDTSRTSGMPRLPLAIPFRDERGRVAGVVFGALGLEWLADHFRERALPEGGSFAIVDRNGTVLVRLPEFEGVVGQPVQDDARALLEGREVITGSRPSLDGREVIFAVVPLDAEPAGLVVAVAVGRAEIMAEYWRAARRSGAFLLVTLGVALGAAWFGSQIFLMRPLDRVTRVVERWRRGDVSARVGPMPDRSEIGRLGEAFDAMADALEQRSAEVAAERERLVLVADALPALVSFIDHNLRYRFVNRAYEEWFRCSRADLLGARLPDVIGEEAFALVKEHAEAALAGARRTFVGRLPYRGAGLRHVSVDYIPAVRAGVVEGFYVFVEDVSRQKRNESLQIAQKVALERAVGGSGLGAALEALAEQAAEVLGAAVAIFVVEFDRKSLLLQASAGVPPTFAAAVDRLPIGPEMPSCGLAAFSGERVIVPDVRADPGWAALRDLAEASGVRACWSTPIRSFGGQFFGSLAVYHPKPRVPDPDEIEATDSLVRTAAILVDRARAEDHQRLLVAELNHRVKNTLAVVQSLTARSLRDAPDPAEGLATFSARLRALAATHDVLTAEGWSGANLADVVRAGVMALEGEAPRLTIAGPAVRLSARAGISLTLALHELATNALKYGALASEAGRVDIRWSLEGAGAGRKLRFAWRESGGPPIAPPTHRGLGMRMLESALPQELHGRSNLSFGPEGLAFELVAPVPGAGED